MKILIVETQYIVALDLSIIVRKAGYQVVGVASSAEAAIELIPAVFPTMVLLDIKLSGTMSGIDLALKLNEFNISFIYVSGNSNKKVLEAALATKPFGFVEKPFRETNVLSVLNGYQEKNGALRLHNSLLVKAE